MQFSTLLIAAPFMVGYVAAICPGFDIAVGSQTSQGTDSRWDVYDDSCNVVDALVTDQNPCDSTMFDCSSSSSINRYTSSKTGLVYVCRTDPDAGSCDSDDISVCCKWDGHQIHSK